MDASGAMTTGWQKIDGKWYFFDESGDAHSGWLYGGTENGKDIWYFTYYGEMLTGNWLCLWTLSSRGLPRDNSGCGVHSEE